MKLTQEQKGLLVLLHMKGGKAVLTEEQAAVAEQMPDLVRITRWGDILATLTEQGGMPVWAIEHFPGQSDLEAVGAWHPLTWRYPLHRQVLVVAATRIEGMWKAYCGPVPGLSHDAEEQPVLEIGCDVGEKVALVLFPHMKGIPYAR